MKVLFDVNYPLAWAEGGFSIQIRQTKLALEKLGVEVEYVDYFAEKAQRADVLHYFGIPANMIMYRAARAMGMKQVITFLAPAGLMQPAWSDYVKRAVRKALIRGFGSQRLFGKMGIGVEQANAFIVLNRAEKNYAMFYYGWPSQITHVIPEGVDDVFFDETVAARHRDALFYPSYICPRKNQVEIAKVAKELKIKVLFAGKDQGEYPEYFNDFQKELDGEYAVWLGEVRDRRELAALYKGTLGTFLASDFDNQPLVLLESLASGRPAMGPDLPSIRSHYGGAIHYSPSAKSSSFPAALAEFNRFCRQGGKQTMNVSSWGDIGKSVYEIYKNVLGNDPR
jgi:glycosyltransferase involved in cell wall biosynthesis